MTGPSGDGYSDWQAGQPSSGGYSHWQVGQDLTDVRTQLASDLKLGKIRDAHRRRREECNHKPRSVERWVDPAISAATLANHLKAKIVEHRSVHDRAGRR